MMKNGKCRFLKKFLAWFFCVNLVFTPVKPVVSAVLLYVAGYAFTQVEEAATIAAAVAIARAARGLRNFQVANIRLAQKRSAQGTPVLEGSGSAMPHLMTNSGALPLPGRDEPVPDIPLCPPIDERPSAVFPGLLPGEIPEHAIPGQPALPISPGRKITLSNPELAKALQDFGTIPPMRGQGGVYHKNIETLLAQRSQWRENFFIEQGRPSTFDSPVILNQITEGKVAGAESRLMRLRMLSEPSFAKNFSTGLEHLIQALVATNATGASAEDLAAARFALFANGLSFVEHMQRYCDVEGLEIGGLIGCDFNLVLMKLSSLYFHSWFEKKGQLRCPAVSREASQAIAEFVYRVAPRVSDQAGKIETFKRMLSQTDLWDKGLFLAKPKLAQGDIKYNSLFSPPSAQEIFSSSVNERLVALILSCNNNNYQAAQAIYAQHKSVSVIDEVFCAFKERYKARFNRFGIERAYEGDPLWLQLSAADKVARFGNSYGGDNRKTVEGFNHLLRTRAIAKQLLERTIGWPENAREPNLDNLLYQVIGLSAEANSELLILDTVSQFVLNKPNIGGIDTSGLFFSESGICKVLAYETMSPFITALSLPRTINNPEFQQQRFALNKLWLLRQQLGSAEAHLVPIVERAVKHLRASLDGSDASAACHEYLYRTILETLMVPGTDTTLLEIDTIALLKDSSLLSEMFANAVPLFEQAAQQCPNSEVLATMYQEFLARIKRGSEALVEGNIDAATFTATRIADVFTSLKASEHPDLYSIFFTRAGALACVPDVGLPLLPDLGGVDAITARAMRALTYHAALLEQALPIERQKGIEDMLKHLELAAAGGELAQAHITLCAAIGYELSHPHVEPFACSLGSLTNVYFGTAQKVAQEYAIRLAAHAVGGYHWRALALPGIPPITKSPPVGNTQPEAAVAAVLSAQRAIQRGNVKGAFKIMAPELIQVGLADQDTIDGFVKHPAVVAFDAFVQKIKEHSEAAAISPLIATRLAVGSNAFHWRNTRHFARQKIRAKKQIRPASSSRLGTEPPNLSDSEDEGERKKKIPRHIKKAGIDPRLPTEPFNDSRLKDITHPQRRASGHYTFKNKYTGEMLRYDKGTPGMTGHRGHDHYHRLNPHSTGSHDKYLDVLGNPVRNHSPASHLYPPEWVWWQ